MTHVPDGPPPGARSVQRKDSTRTLRLLAPVAAMSSLIAIAFVGQVMILDGAPDRPELRGIAEANAALPWAYALAGALWLLSFAPGLEVASRVRVLRVCYSVLCGAAVAWIVWALLRHAMAAT